MMSFEWSSETAWAPRVLLWFIYLFYQECFAPSIFNNITAKSELLEVGKAEYEQWKLTDSCKI